MRNMTFDILPGARQWQGTFSPNDNLFVSVGDYYPHCYSRSGDVFTKFTYSSLYATHYDAAFSPDGTKLVLLINGGSTLSMRIIGVAGATFTTLVSEQAISTEGGTYRAKCAFSPSGALFAVAHTASPYVSLYSVSGSTFTKLPNPATLPSGAAKGVAFSSDGTKLCVAHSGGVTIYSISGTTFTAIGTAPTGMGASNGCDFSPDSSKLAVASDSSPYINIYDISGTTYAKLDNPGTLPPDKAYDCEFASTGNQLAVAHKGSPYITLYGISGNTYSKVGNPPSLPIADAFGCAFSSGGDYLAVSSIASPYANAYNISADEIPEQPTIISPTSVYVDVGIVQTFEWQHNISSGTEQTKAELQYSTDGSTWVALATITGADESVEIGAGTLPFGVFYWRVRTYNQSDEYGDWSDPSALVGIGRPATPAIVSVTATPRPTISWTATGQQAYQVMFGTVDSGIKFGTVKTLKCPEYLANGTYTVKVKVQNSNGLWSEWAEQSVTVSNTAGNAITLSVAASHVAALSWVTTGSYDKYYVYRDGTLVAKTTAKNYIDNTSIDSVAYQVRGAYDASDNYGLSSAVSVTVDTDTVMIFDISGSTWLTLGETASSDRTNGVSESQKVAYMFFAGCEYQSVEISEFKTKKIAFEAAFSVKADADAFAALLGKLVCIKDQWGNMVIGVLAGHSKASGRFYQSYSCEVEQISYSEVVSHD